MADIKKSLDSRKKNEERRSIKATTALLKQTQTTIQFQGVPDISNKRKKKNMRTKREAVIYE